MNKKILTMLISFYSVHTLAADTPWIFTSTIPAKNEMITIARKESCRPLNTQLMNAKCVQYKMGYVCPQEDNSQFIITTYSSKNDCSKALKKARRILAKQ
jgi:hypothetical protein